MEPTVQIHSFVLVCRDCKGERLVKFDSPLRSAAELKWWLDNRTEPCPCGGLLCDILIPFRAKGQEDVEGLQANLEDEFELPVTDVGEDD